MWAGVGCWFLLAAGCWLLAAGCHAPEKACVDRRKSIVPQFPLPKHTFDLRFRHGTHADEMHLLFFESSLPASRLPLRPFLAGAS